MIGVCRALSLVTTGSVYQADHPLLQDLFSEVLSTPEATVKRALDVADDVARNTEYGVLLCSTYQVDASSNVSGSDSAEATQLLDSRLIHSLLAARTMRSSSIAS